MFIKQYYLGCLSHASYLVVNEKAKSAVVIDPQRDIKQYLEDAKSLGVEIQYVILTHFHADFLAGHIELRDKVGAKICMGVKANAEFNHIALNDGDQIEIGETRLEVLETPGHTPEGISILVYKGPSGTENPYAVFTGDTLFIGDVGRPDLLASIGVSADDLAEMLYESLFDKLFNLPDETIVYPAHGAGSLCGKNLSDDRVSTIGEQKKYNYAFQPMSMEEFKKIVVVDQPNAPEYFVFDAIANRKERENLKSMMQRAVRPLSLKQVQELQDDGAIILDVRETIDFEGSHFKGAISIPLKGKYATWCGTILNHKDFIVIIANEGEEDEAIMRLGRIGFDNVIGFLKNGMSSLEENPELIETIPRITAARLNDKMDSFEEFLILDVRTDKEHQEYHIPGSLNIPLDKLDDQFDRISNDKELVVHCAGGYRSGIACSLLQKNGHEKVFDLVGGIKAWNMTNRSDSQG